MSETRFIGPCPHGSDPWDRCNECDSKTAEQVLMDLLSSAERDLATLRAGVERLAGEFNERAEWSRPLRSIPKERLLRKCASDLRALLAPSRDEKKGTPERCACGSHAMNAARRPGVWIMELDERGKKHGFDRCPPDVEDGPRAAPPGDGT